MDQIEQEGKISGHGSSVHSKIATWQKKDKDKANSTAANSSEPYHGMLHMQALGKGSDYGRPQEGTKTEYRGKQAGVRVSNEIVELCTVIRENGYKWSDSVYVISFGTLFEIYTRISNKLVGMLMRGRKQGLIDFEGEMLFQRRDDDVKVWLLKMPEELEQDIEKRKRELESHTRRDT